MQDHDIIIGIHSIAEILNTNSRNYYELVTTKDGLDELKKRGQVRVDKIPQEKLMVVDSHKLQELAKFKYNELDYEFSRVPSQVFLICEPVNQYEPTWLYEELMANGPIKILALDQVTDVHNAAAIMRTAAFYNVRCVLVSMKGNFGMGPNFARIASGATEHVKIVRCSSLPKILTKLTEMGVNVIGLSEHASDNELKIYEQNSTCLVLGAEDEGMSHAVGRVVSKTISLTPLGKIKSLNVSVAAAVAMEKVFK
jgi:23S rRNA (guanosine2251-2'-O)-methyltransferase